MKYQDILVLGGSGATGQWVVRMALERGHKVTALVRSKTALEPRDGLKIIQGDVSDSETLERVTQGKQAVLSCLGIRRKTRPARFHRFCPPSISPKKRRPSL